MTLVSHTVFAVPNLQGEPVVYAIQNAFPEQDTGLAASRLLGNSLRAFGISDPYVVASRDATGAVRQAIENGFSPAIYLQDQVDQEKFSAAEEAYGAFAMVVTFGPRLGADDALDLTGEAKRVELNDPVDNLASRIADLPVGAAYSDIGKIIAVRCHADPAVPPAKGVLFDVPTIHESVFGQQRLLPRDSVILSNKSGATAFCDDYVVFSAAEFREFADMFCDKTGIRQPLASGPSMTIG